MTQLSMSTKGSRILTAASRKLVLVSILALSTLLALSFAVVLGHSRQVGAAPSIHQASATFQNPVYNHDFPDPFVMKVGKTYYAYSTNDPAFGRNVPVIRSSDLVHWKFVRDAFPKVGQWAGGSIWAPEILRVSKSKYILYYTAHSTDIGKQCIGTAVSKSPTGPFRDKSKKPFICQVEMGGDIDASPFKDNGKLYLLWKSDGNCCGIRTYIFLQRLSRDGLKLVNHTRTALNQNDDPWEGGVIEGPEMRKHDGKYYLFYSANDYDSDKYAVGYSVCTTPAGFCADGSENPILHSGCDAAGPGGETIFTDGAGQMWVAYHAFHADKVGYESGGQRVLWLDRLVWVNDKPVIEGPTCSSQSAPTP